MSKTLGLVEVKGLALAIQTVDIMSKSANIKIVGLESTNGFGWRLIKVMGDVGSVKSAVEVGVLNAKNQDGLVSYKVIARVSEELCAGLIKAAIAPSEKETKKTTEASSVSKKAPLVSESLKKTPEPSKVIKKAPEVSESLKKTPEASKVIKKAPEVSESIKKIPEATSIIKNSSDVTETIKKPPVVADVTKKEPAKKFSSTQAPARTTGPKKTPAKKGGNA